MAQLRLQRELEEMAKNPPAFCTAGPVNRRDLFHWQAWITGPFSSPYEGGMFKLDINFPKNYPSAPPHIVFVTPIYHMNVWERGRICLDLLDSAWRSDINLSKLLLSICSLLSNPNPHGGPKADQFLLNPRAYNDTAKQWTLMHAKKIY